MAVNSWSVHLFSKEGNCMGKIISTSTCNWQLHVNQMRHTVVYTKDSQTFQAGTPKIIIFEVGTPLYLFDSIPQIHIVKIADLKAHNASHCEAL